MANLGVLASSVALLPVDILDEYADRGLYNFLLDGARLWWKHLNQFSLHAGVCIEAAPSDSSHGWANN